MKKILITMIIALLTACSPLKQSVKNSKQQVVQEIDRAQSLYEMGEVDAAIAQLTQMVDKSSYSQSYDRAYELIVEWLLQTNNYAEAKRYASYFLKHHGKSPSAHKITTLFNNQALRENHAPEEPLVKPEPEPENEIDLDLEKKKHSLDILETTKP